MANLLAALVASSTGFVRRVRLAAGRSSARLPPRTIVEARRSRATIRCGNEPEQLEPKWLRAKINLVEQMLWTLGVKGASVGGLSQTDGGAWLDVLTKLDTHPRRSGCKGGPCGGNPMRPTASPPFATRPARVCFSNVNITDEPTGLLGWGLGGPTGRFNNGPR